MLAYQDVFDGRHFFEQTDVLVGASDTHCGDLIWTTISERDSIETQGASLGPVKASDAVEKRGLASTIGADDTDNAALWNREIERVDSSQPAELFGYFGRF
jgi:hypothetical protein